MTHPLLHSATSGPAAATCSPTRVLGLFRSSVAPPVRGRRGWQYLAAQPRASPIDDAPFTPEASRGAAASSGAAPQPSTVPVEAGAPVTVSAEAPQMDLPSSQHAKSQGAGPRGQLSEPQQSSEPRGPEQDGQQESRQQQTHGPGLCACCRPSSGAGEPVTQIITYVDGVVLEVETADGVVIYFDPEGEEDEDAEPEGEHGAPGKSVRGQGAAAEAAGAAAWPGAGSASGGVAGGPLVFVPDLVIPPSLPPPPDYWQG